jgi:hypothetical protein
VAKIGGLYYNTLAGAIENATAGQTITLIADVEASEIIMIEKAITLDGNGKTLTSTAGRAINIDCAGAVTIKKLCDGLDITLGEFFSTPEFDNLEQEIK